ncbi:MAG: extracellular solute-binding protein [Bosea sp. (in: a-proteobacteria)]|jgi:putative spermidine/putrescine transport system substrate-binding protein|uniref:extracellular solute-binding protein n=1 Tax=Bosea sp. (in: a-proteobacteria) TaxID=1871050 RepID=UPI001D59C14A|nr:extracellular solute-binding protein [Bosea sp. (in: a-proteobacteria)]MBX9874754.1 extracellular solute-binding protein [Beijerinckiaceae bacterium]MCZ8041118.1 extracellular solute-binding protein [Beijerinckiaceae bacterium]MDP3601472.1 extracellular solute-binding protein [Bosea sp. (in: a-proteobacteria)]WRH58703.1 MAG: extracellular solute-binding protein [Bosea sp. (in: a-proteobacteria)]
MTQMNRRDLLAGAGALGLASLLPLRASASGSLTAAIYPGTWEEAYRGVVAPALKKNAGVDVAFDALFAVDQVAKVRAARGVPPFDCFVLDPGPAAAAQAAGLFEPIDASKLTNAAKIPAGLIKSHGVTCNAQVVGIAYNPKKFATPPKGWADLFKSPYVERLGLTGFQTTFGTVSIIEMAKVFGGSATNVEPVFAELKKAVSKAAAVAAPAAMPGLFQQGQIDIMYTNTNTVATLKGRGVDIEFIKPETGAITFQTTLHIVKGADNVANAYKYIDTAISSDVQAELQKQPYNMVPINKDVKLVETLDIKSLDELATMVTHDWTVINPQRAAWIERFNKEITK